MEDVKPKSVIDLRKLMQKLGLGTNEFARACGMTSQSMSQFLRPEKSLTTNTIYRMATALDIDPRDMFFPVDEEGQQPEQPAEQPTDTTQEVQTVAYCPHCGGKVQVGVVLV